MAAAVSEAALYTQLSHFQRLLDPSSALARIKDDSQRLDATRSGSAHSPPTHNSHPGRLVRAALSCINCLQLDRQLHPRVLTC